MSRLLGLWYTVRTFLRRDEADRITRDEVEFHLEQQTRRHVETGLSPADARTLALRQFGGTANWREATAEARAGHVVESIAQDVRYAIRGFGRARAYTIVAVATMTIAIGAATAVFTLVHGVLFSRLPFPNADRIVAIYEAGETSPDLPLSIPNFVDWKAASHTLDRMAAVFRLRVAVGTGRDPVIVDAASVSDEFFDVFGVAPSLGRTMLPGDGDSGAGTVLLSHDFWQTVLAGDSSIVGKPLSIGTQHPTVIGVMPPAFRYPAGVRLWLSRAIRATGPRNVISEEVIGRLAPGTTVPQARAELAGIAEALHRTYPDLSENQALSATVRPLRDDIVGPARALIAALAGAIGLMLVIACVNLAGSNLARHMARRHELALRVALGAGRGRLLRQLGTENLVITLASGVLGLAVASWLVRLVPAIAPSSLPRLMSRSLDARVIAFALVVSLGAGLAVGVLPAWRVRLGDLRTTIASGGRGIVGGTSARGRGALIAAEVAMSLVLLVGAGLSVRTLRLLLDRDNGFVATDLVIVETRLPPRGYGVPGAAARFYDAAMARVRAIPGVEHVAGASAIPLSPAGTGFVTVEGRARSAGAPDIAGYRLVTDDFFQTLGIPLLAGRTFGVADDSVSEHVAVVSTSMARKYWPGENPLGKRFKAESFDDHAAVWLRVIGVVPDVRYWTLEAETVPEHYVSARQRPERAYNFNLIVKSAVPASVLVPAVRKAILAGEPGVATDFQTMQQRIDASALDRRFMMLVFTGFGVIALLLVAIGVYGVFSHLVAQRTHEIGVRMAIGASRRSILALVLGSALRPVAVGLALGAAASAALGRIMDSLVYGISTRDPASFAGGIAVLVTVAVAASLIPARRAAIVDPMIALRAE